MLSLTVYPIVFLVLWCIFGLFAIILLVRFILTIADPNPFGRIGRSAFMLRRKTEKWVYPAARMLARFGVNTRYAPLVALFIGFLLTYFLTQVIGNTFFVIDGLSAGIGRSDPSIVIGFILYGILSLFVLLIFIRFIAAWFVSSSGKLLSAVSRITDPILVPFRRWIPQVGMFDLSAMIVLLIIWFLQMIVLNVFVR